MQSSFWQPARVALAGALLVVALGSALGTEDSVPAWQAADEAHATPHLAAALAAQAAEEPYVPGPYGC